jgi:hypothetical protein
VATLDVSLLEIPLSILVLLSGTVVLVLALTVMARIVDRLIDVAVARRGGVTEGDGPGVRRVAGRPRRRGLAGLPRTVAAAMLAGSLLFALAWATFVLGRMRDLG